MLELPCLKSLFFVEDLKLTPVHLISTDIPGQGAASIHVAGPVLS